MTKEEMMHLLWEEAMRPECEDGVRAGLLGIRDFVSKAQIVPDTHTLTVKRLTPDMIRKLQIRTVMMSYFAENMAEAYQCAHEFYETALLVSPRPEDAS